MPRTAKKATKVQETKVVPLITRQEYIADIKVRWQIHTEEVAKLGEDIQKAYDFLLPFFKKYVDYIRESYTREFGPAK
jgi:hypothetical protein|tara:strand:+ start:127 stop:360 length:234 start_codon:yes stop_codon:yes gene_type:complete